MNYSLVDDCFTACYVSEKDFIPYEDKKQMEEYSKKFNFKINLVNHKSAQFVFQNQQDLDKFLEEMN